MDTKKLLLICGGIVGGFLILLLVIWLISLSKPRYITYEALEAKMVAASKNYVKDNESKFANDNARYNLGYQTLVAGEYIKPIDELIEDYEKCSATVTIIKTNGEYSYVPYLNCGDKYTTVELYKQILNDNKTVTSGSGLYRDANGTYYFKGKNLNNYVAFGSMEKRNKMIDNIWQIISISNDHTVKLRATFAINDTKTQWDDRYNVTEDKYVGYNLFDDSIIQEILTNTYEKKYILNEEQRSKLVPRRLCVAPRAVEDPSKDGSTECSVLSKKYYYFSTLTPYEIIRISTDENCKDMSSYSCSNFNYLSQNSQSEEWLITSAIGTDYQAWAYDGFSFNPVKTKNTKNLYLVIELNEYSFYKTGDGSLENPYRLKLSSETKETEEKTEK